EGEFVASDLTEFPMDAIMACCSEDDPQVRRLLDAIAEWRRRTGRAGKRSLKAELGLAEDVEQYELDPRPGRRYLASWDLGKKPTRAGRNATVGMCFDITELPWTLVAFRYEEGSGYLMAMNWIEEWQRKYSSKGTEAYTVIDASGKGDVVNEII